MAKTRDTVQELPAQDVGFLFGTMFDLTTLPKELKHTGKVAKGEFKIVAHFPAIHEKNGTEAAYLARHRTFRGGLYATYQDGPYKIDEINWDATNRAGVHMVTMTKYGQVVEFPSQPSKTMPGSLKLMVQELVESLKTPGFIIRCSGLGGALEPKKGTTDEYNVILLNGDVKCPKKLANHVPTKYHAEDESIFLAQTGPWCGNAEDYQKPPWIKGPGRKTRAMRSAKKQKNIELREKRNAEQMTQMGDSLFPVIPNTGGGDSALGSGRGVPQWYGSAEGHGQLRFTTGFSRTSYGDQKMHQNYEVEYSVDYNDGPFTPEYRHAVEKLIEKDIKKELNSNAHWGKWEEALLDNKSFEMDNHIDYLGPNGKEVTIFYNATFMPNKIISETTDGTETFYEDDLNFYAESAFDKLANKVAQGYIKKGKSKEEALEIGRKTAYKIGVKKYGKAGMKNKSMEGRMRRKSAEETMNFEFSNLPGLPVVANDFGESSALMSGNSVPQWYGAEEFEAPMPFYPPSKGDVDRVQKAIRSRHRGIRFKGSPTYLTERKDGSNKYHVFQMTNRGGFNGYGRIGHTMTLFGPMSPQQYQSKLKSKMKKGYRETGF